MEDHNNDSPLEEHRRHLQKHCRICKRGWTRIHGVKETLNHNELEVSWQALFLEILTLDTTADDPYVHPPHFCHTCHQSLMQVIKNPSLSCNIQVQQFRPHSDSSCDLCKYHTKGAGGGRPKKKKRGAKKTDDSHVDLNVSFSAGHDYIGPDVSKGGCRSPAVDLAYKILTLRNPSEPTNSTNTNPTQPQPSTSETTPKAKTRGPGKSKKLPHEYENKSSIQRVIKPIVEDLEIKLKEQLRDPNVWLPYVKDHLPSHAPDPTDKFSAIFSKSKPHQYTPIYSLSQKIKNNNRDEDYIGLYNNTVDRAGKKLYAPPSSVKAMERTLMPGYICFELTPPSSLLPSSNHLDARERCEPIDIMEDFSSDVATDPPNVLGYRYRYDKVVAQTLSEYTDIVLQRLNDLRSDGIEIPDVLNVIFKDGADGLGDVSLKRGKGLRALPKHAIRYSCVLMEISFSDGNGTHYVYRNATPNSPKYCRTIMCALADENDDPSSSLCVLPSAKECEELQGKLIRLRDQDFSYRITIHTTMVDEKLERHYSGLDSTSSNFCCTCCFYNKKLDVDKNVVDGNSIERNFADSEIKALERKFNELGLSELEMERQCKGVKTQPLIKFKPCMDATHADINISATFVRKLILREMAAPNDEDRTWEATGAMKDALVHAESEFDKVLKELVGSNSLLMLDGNYGRDMVDISKIAPVIQRVMEREDRKEAVMKFLTLYNALRIVWRSNYPKDNHPDEVAQYKVKARQLGEHLRDEFGYIKKWPNYLHKIICHVPDIVEGLGSCGAYSSEPNEATNKDFRYIRKHHSRKNVEFETRDNLRYAWLRTCKVIQDQGVYVATQKKCSVCHELGHNARTCPKK